jgi:hypothetical protein
MPDLNHTEDDGLMHVIFYRTSKVSKWQVLPNLFEKKAYAEAQAKEMTQYYFDVKVRSCEHPGRISHPGRIILD